MTFTHLLLRYGELFLKGKNRGYFEQKLCQNIKSIAKVPAVQRIQGRLLMDFSPQHHLLTRVFGLVSYSPTLKVEKEIDVIERAALDLLKIIKAPFGSRLIVPISHSPYLRRNSMSGWANI